MRHRWSTAAVCLAMTMAAGVEGCSSAGSSTGWGTPTPTPSKTATPLGLVPASTSMTVKYGITNWKLFVGSQQFVVTGYRADGTAARGVQTAWFQQAADGTPAHVRVMMLDGTGAAVRRYVGGGASGQLTDDQMLLIATEELDFANYQLAEVKGTNKSAPRHAAARPGEPYAATLGGTTGPTILADDPGTGPKCSAAWAGNSAAATGCGVDTIRFAAEPNPVSGMFAGYSCTDWAKQSYEASSTCTDENNANCTTNADGTPNLAIDFGFSLSLTQEDVCANYPNSPGCGGDPAANDTGANSAPTNDQINQATANTSCLSCPPGTSNVTANPQNGDVTAGTPTDDGSGGDAGGASSDTAGGTSTDPSAGDSTSGGMPSSCGGQGGDCSSGQACCGGLSCDSNTQTCTSGSSCVSDGGDCSSQGCCAGLTCNMVMVCNSGGDTTGGDDAGSGPGSCANEGDACGSGCCSGLSCDSDSNTCTSGGGSSSPDAGDSPDTSTCAASGGSCSSDGDCCEGSCGTCNNTCGGASSGASGTPCSSDSDCCNGCNSSDPDPSNWTCQ